MMSLINKPFLKNRVCICFSRPIDSYVGGVCTVVDNYLKNEKLFSKKGYQIFLFDYHSPRKIKNTKIDNVYGLFKQRKALLRFIKENNISILHIHTSRGFLYLKDVMLGKYIKKRCGIKILLTIHVGDISTVFSRIPSLLHKRLLKNCNTYFEKIIFLSNTIKNQFINKGLAFKKAEVLYNFYYFDKADLIRAKKSSNKKILELTYIGMINKDKGIIELLKAINQIKNQIKLKLNICGTLTDPSIEEEYNELVAKNKNIILECGYVDSIKKYEILTKTDILVLASYHEGFPLVILEALATGCGIISTPVGAIPEVLTSDNYIPVEIGSVSSICDAIMLLNNKDSVLKRMKDANIKRSEDFTIENNINKLIKIYDCI